MWRQDLKPYARWIATLFPFFFKKKFVFTKFCTHAKTDANLTPYQFFPILFSLVNPKSNRLRMVEASLVNLAELGVLTVGVIITLQQLRDIKQTRENELETRQAQLFMQVWQQYNSVEYAMQRYEVYDMQWEDYDDFQRKYLGVPAKEMRPYASYVSIARLFEGLWLLIQEKLIDEKLVYQNVYG